MLLLSWVCVRDCSGNPFLRSFFSGLKKIGTESPTAFSAVTPKLFYLLAKYSANGPSANAGKNDNAAMMAITAKTMTPKIVVSVFSVPALSGMYFLLANNPAIANGPIIGKNLLNNKTIPVEMFQNGLLSPKPSKPEPLLAALEVNSYSISENPWKPGLLSQPVAFPENQ